MFSFSRTTPQALLLVAALLGAPAPSTGAPGDGSSTILTPEEDPNYQFTSSFYGGMLQLAEGPELVQRVWRQVWEDAPRMHEHELQAWMGLQEDVFRRTETRVLGYVAPAMDQVISELRDGFEANRPNIPEAEIPGVRSLLALLEGLAQETRRQAAEILRDRGEPGADLPDLPEMEGPPAPEERPGPRDPDAPPPGSTAFGA